VYVKEQRRKVEEEKRLAQEAELKRRRETPGTWEHFQARCEETDRRTREANAWDTTSKTWPPPRSPPGNFSFVTF
jgi:hypothetical protein